MLFTLKLFSQNIAENDNFAGSPAHPHTQQLRAAMKLQNSRRKEPSYGCKRARSDIGAGFVTTSNNMSVPAATDVRRVRLRRLTPPRPLELTGRCCPMATEMWILPRTATFSGRLADWAVASHAPTRPLFLSSLSRRVCALPGTRGPGSDGAWRQGRRGTLQVEGGKGT